MTRRELLVALGGSAVSAACGYSLAGRGSFLPSYIRLIAVPLFLNRTQYVGLEQLFTEKVRVEFQGRGRYSVKPTEEGADGVVRGDITGISASPVGFTDTQLASRYRFTVSVAVKFDDLRQQKTLWENPALSFSDEYELASRTSIALAGAAFLDQERVAIDRLSTDFARSVVQAILEAF
ncbi:MAG TPA: LPS assembly lipoprotein LptE [Vicinamibacterales bacterium]|nr:LPS assembly lipoprotein LptE [Vicinamibacterales bacterium]